MRVSLVGGIDLWHVAPLSLNVLRSAEMASRYRQGLRGLRAVSAARQAASSGGSGLPRSGGLEPPGGPGFGQGIAVACRKFASYLRAFARYQGGLVGEVGGLVLVAVEGRKPGPVGEF